MQTMIDGVEYAISVKYYHAEAACDAHPAGDETTPIRPSNCQSVVD